MKILGVVGLAATLLLPSSYALGDPMNPNSPDYNPNHRPARLGQPTNEASVEKAPAPTLIKKQKHKVQR